MGGDCQALHFVDVVDCHGFKIIPFGTCHGNRVLAYGFGSRLENGELACVIESVFVLVLNIHSVAEVHSAEHDFVTRTQCALVELGVAPL